MTDIVKILFVGDVVGRAGRSALREGLPLLKEKYSPTVTVVNGENASSGFGINKKNYKDLKTFGVDVVTTGNHFLDKREIEEVFRKEKDIVRPANYKDTLPGKGYTVLTVNGVKLAVVNLIGRVFMKESNCPFEMGKKIIDEIKKETNIIIVDFHAEATSEKQAFANYVDGDVSFVVGTHSHVQTADERILEKGTGFITDAGMTGALDSIIGMEKEGALKRFLTGEKAKLTVAKGEKVLSGVYVEVDKKSGKALKIERVREYYKA